MHFAQVVVENVGDVAGESRSSCNEFTSDNPVVTLAGLLLTVSVEGRCNMAST